MLVNHPEASGVYQVSSDPINKYDLLLLFREKLGHNIEIVPDNSFVATEVLILPDFVKNLIIPTNVGKNDRN